MANIWKYSNLGQRERLDLIRGGNLDVYNTEKSKNEMLKKERSALGLSTSEIDDWQDTIDNAYTSGSKKRVRANLPKFSSGRVMGVNKAFREYMDGLENKYEASKSEAVADAEASLRYLDEWLANNGYSRDSGYAEKEKKGIEAELEREISELERVKKSDIESALKKFYAMLG